MGGLQGGKQQQSADEREAAKVLGRMNMDAQVNMIHGRDLGASDGRSRTEYERRDASTSASASDATPRIPRDGRRERRPSPSPAPLWRGIFYRFPAPRLQVTQKS